MNWDDLKIVLAIARAGSLSAAAHSLGVNQTTVGRRLNALENHLCATLFLRSKSSFLLTETGEVYIRRAERIESEALALIDEVGAAAQQAKGTVRISTMSWIFSYLIVPKLPDFSNRYPGISIHAVSGLREYSLSKRETELALRFEMQPRQNELCLPVTKLGYSLYAPVGYKADSIPWVGYVDDYRYSAPQTWQDKSGSREEELHFRANDAGIVYQAVRTGLGKGLLPDVLAMSDPALVRLSGKAPEIKRELRILVHKDLQHVTRVATVIDWLRDCVFGPEAFERASF